VKLKKMRRNLKKGSFDWKLRGLVPFSLVENDLRANDPPDSHGPEINKKSFPKRCVFQRKVKYSIQPKMSKN